MIRITRTAVVRIHPATRNAKQQQQQQTFTESILMEYRVSPLLK